METGIEGQPFSQLLKIVKNIIELFKDKDADLIAFGHNHQMHLYDDNKTIYFNLAHEFKQWSQCRVRYCND